jgi:hypothetical protein
MRALSVNVGLPREVLWRSMAITTGIYKQPVAGRVPLGTLNLDGDRQRDAPPSRGRGLSRSGRCTTCRSCGGYGAAGSDAQPPWGCLTAPLSPHAAAGVLERRRVGVEPRYGRKEFPAGAGEGRIGEVLYPV